MQITPAALAGMFTTFDVRFQQAYAALTPWWQKIASEVPSKSEQNTYGWMAKIPTLRKWIGERQLQSLASYAYTLVNDNYELTIEVDRNKIEDDTYGLYAPHVDEMGWQSKKWPDYMAVDVLQAAVSTACFDGQNFFDASHPISKYAPALGTYSNNFTATALNYDNYRSVRASMLSYKGEDGKPLAIEPDLLVCPPQLEGIGRAILHADFVAPQTYGGVTNVGSQQNLLKGTADLLVIPELAGEATTWYLLSTKRPIKPLVFQLRMNPEFVYMNRPDDINVFMQRKFMFGVQARGAVGFTLPFLAARAIA